MDKLEFWYHHSGISVFDMDASIAWWQKMLDFQLERRYILEHIPAEIACLSNGPLTIELLKFPRPVLADPTRHTPDDDLKTCGNKHTAFSVHDVKKFTDQLRRRGVDVVWVKELANGRAAGFIRDNEGNLIEFVQFPKPAHQIACIYPRA